MTIDFDLVIDTEEDTVDMKAGLDSMQGISDAIRCIGETLLTDKVPERLTSKSNIRTSLKKSFKGSYGHIFSLDLHDDKSQANLRRLGRSTFVELISYFLDESMYRDTNPLSEKAQKTLDKLEEKAEKLVDQLRTASLGNIHEISVKFDHDIKIRYRKNRDDQTVIASFDRDSAQVLNAEQSDEVIDLRVVITRLNIHTGNGRLQIEGENETVAFGFGTEYKTLRIRAKKTLSSNLDRNNGVETDNWQYLKLTVSPIKLMNGKVIKYLVRQIHAD